MNQADFVAPKARIGDFPWEGTAAPPMFPPGIDWFGIEPKIPTGWKCPVCLIVNAPSVLQCPCSIQ